MITDKNFSLRLLKAVLKRGRGLSDHNIAHPEREWLIGLSIALLMLLAGIAWSVMLYQNFAEIRFISIEPNNASEQVYRGSDVARALETLDERKTLHQLTQEQLQTRSQTPSFILLEETTGAVDDKPQEPITDDEGLPDQPEEIPPETSPAIPDIL